MKQADPLTLPLAGLSLVEASAGTGKTTLLVRLYLRALLVEGRTVDQLLAVTYTRAATGELSVRIRRELAEAAEQLQKDEPEASWEALFALAGNDRELLGKRIEAALAGFDEKAVFTIHGFCQRMLADNAFEAGAAFASEQAENEDALRAQIAADFWRRRVGSDSPIYVKWFVDTFKSPEKLLRDTLEKALHVSGPLAIEPKTSKASINQAEIAFKTAVTAAARLWKNAAGTPPFPSPLVGEGQGEGGNREAAANEADHPHPDPLPSRERGNKVRTLPPREKGRGNSLLLFLHERPGVSGSRYKDGPVNHIIADWESWLAGPPSPELPENFKLLTASHLADSMNKGHAPPDEPFFDAAEALKEAAEALDSLWRQEAVAAAFEFVRGEARRRKLRTRELGFDDMLSNLRDALKAPGGKTLARRIARQYPLILVDEFQDTDPLQHEIFTAIHAAAADPHGLVLIGDPKQAIYRFRGADIFTYMQARAACKKTGNLFNLTKNYRSAPPLLTAVNELFGNADEPFGYAEIPYNRVTSGRDPPIEALAMPAGDNAPLSVVWEEAPEGGKLTKDQAGNRAAGLCAGEIARLLEQGRQGRARIDDQPLQAGDIAVLVNSNRHGRQIQDALRQRGIAAAMVATQSVFAGSEAEELGILLAAIAEPRNGRLLRRALATQLIGATAPELTDWTRDEARWGEIVDRFREYHALWQARGFAAMFARLLHDKSVREGSIIERTLARPDGERALTNLRHLAELLGAEAARRPGIAPLLAWFGAEREEEAKEESRQLRLESDENLVRIATIHKAKGLQYPVVFLPFLWDGKKDGKDKAVLAHDEDYRAVLDLGSSDMEERRAEAGRERHAENVRTTYVALTRAQRACYLIALPANQCEESALAKLLNVDGPSDFQGRLQDWVKRAGEAMTFRAPLPGRSAGRETIEKPHGKAREFPYPERLQQRFHVASYSLLVAGAQGAAAEEPEHDEAIAQAPVIESPQGIHRFPAGAASGTFLHALIEELSFDADAPTIGAATRRQLGAHGFDADEWTPVLADWLAALFATPLGTPDCSLSAIPDDKRLNEMEFHFLLKDIDAAELDRAVADFAPRVSCPDLRFHPLAGQMKGYIDLIFEHDGRYWVADYKSNRLGGGLDDYTPTALDQAMAEHRYDLQYLIYTLALHRYLQTRIPDYDYEQHFGGVLYLFLRGMAPDAPQPRGIWHTRPSREAIEHLDAYLAGAAP